MALDLEAQDTAAIEALIAAMTDGWNRGNAGDFARRFAKDGSFTNIFGTTVYGREAFERRHAEILSTIFKGTSVKLPIGKLRFLRADIAIADLNSEVNAVAGPPSGISVARDGILRSKTQLVLVKEMDGWWIASFHNVAVTPLPTHP